MVFVHFTYSTLYTNSIPKTRALFQNTLQNGSCIKHNVYRMYKKIVVLFQQMAKTMTEDCRECQAEEDRVPVVLKFQWRCIPQHPAQVENKISQTTVLNHFA